MARTFSSLPMEAIGETGKKSETVSVGEYTDLTSVGNNLRGRIYDTHSGEIFWDPPDTSKIFAIEYEIFRNGVLIRTCDCRSHYDIDLMTHTDYRFAVVPVGAPGARGQEASIVVRIPTSETIGPPENLRGEVYSSSALELFWDRNPLTLRYVIYRDGLQIATTDGISYFDHGLQSGKHFRYSMKAINALGVESESSDINLRTRD